MSTTTAGYIAKPAGGRINPPPGQLDEPDSRPESPLLCAGDDNWEKAVLVWNGLVTFELHQLRQSG
jgi:hypothetical protein